MSTGIWFHGCSYLAITNQQVCRPPSPSPPCHPGCPTRVRLGLIIKRIWQRHPEHGHDVQVTDSNQRGRTRMRHATAQYIIFRSFLHDVLINQALHLKWQNLAPGPRDLGQRVKRCLLKKKKKNHVIPPCLLKVSLHETVHRRAPK